ELYDPVALELAARLELPRWLLVAGEWGEFELVFALAPEDEEDCLEALAGTAAAPRRAGRFVAERDYSIHEDGDRTARIDALEVATALRQLERDGGLVDALSGLVGRPA